jgi:mono/diheme cytochrome c family protein
MKRFLWISASILAGVLLAGALFASQFNLSALAEPGKAETLLATKAKRFFIRRASRGVILLQPKDMKATLLEGDKIFGTDCSECHGNSGRKPTDSGRWMYPRAADLGSMEVQQYSDRELFWIIKNGIRLSGMPAFGQVESDENIRDLVHFVRTLPANASSKSGGDKH